MGWPVGDSDSLGVVASLCVHVQFKTLCSSSINSCFWNEGYYYLEFCFPDPQISYEICLKINMEGSELISSILRFLNFSLELFIIDISTNF